MDHVHQVRPPIGGFAASGFPKTREAAPAAIVMVIRRRSKPEIPIESRRRIAVRRGHLLPTFARKTKAVKKRFDISDLADFAAADHLRNFLVVFPRTLLSAARHHAVVLVG